MTESKFNQIPPRYIVPTISKKIKRVIRNMPTEDRCEFFTNLIHGVSILLETTITRFMGSVESQDGVEETISCRSLAEYWDKYIPATWDAPQPCRINIRALKDIVDINDGVMRISEDGRSTTYVIPKTLSENGVYWLMIVSSHLYYYVDTLLYGVDAMRRSLDCDMVNRESIYNTISYQLAKQIGELYFYTYRSPIPIFDIPTVEDIFGLIENAKTHVEDIRNATKEEKAE